MTEKSKFSNPHTDIHHMLAEWAAACAERTLHIFEDNQLNDDRPRHAIYSVRAWVRGTATMVECRKAAFAAHAAARDAKHPAAVAAARAAGQAAAVAHMFNHCSYAADYAAKAAGLAHEDQALAFTKERTWQRDHLQEELQVIGFPKDI